MDLNYSLLFSKDPATGTSLETDKSNAHSENQFSYGLG
jgi:hypothetical protein